MADGNGKGTGFLGGLKSFGQSEAGMSMGMGAGAEFLKNLFGSSTTTTTSGRSGFDMSMLPMFLKQQGAAQGLIGQATAGRQQQLGGGFDDLFQILRGYGQQEEANINERYSGLANQSRMNLKARGLGNTSLRPDLLVERERNRAMGDLRQRQQQVVGGAQLQRTQMSDAANRDQFQFLAQLFNLMPRALAGSQATSSTQTQRNKGLIG